MATLSVLGTEPAWPSFARRPGNAGLRTPGGTEIHALARAPITVKDFQIDGPESDAGQITTDDRLGGPTGGQDVERNESILDALALRIHVLSLDQIARTWFGEQARPAEGARRLMERLVKSGLAAAKREYSYPMLPLTGPILAWNPGQAEPDLGAIAYALQSRWPDTPSRIVEVYTSTPQLANRLGGFDGRLRHRDQVTHDLHVSEIYLRLYQTNPDLACQWMGEELRKSGQEYGEKLPDAVIADESGHPVRAIEFGGRYPKKRVQAFFEHCVQRNLAFELW